jgi:diguanylate cyclase (GGDEF)-like protein
MSIELAPPSTFVLACALVAMSPAFIGQGSMDRYLMTDANGVVTTVLIVSGHPIEALTCTALTVVVSAVRKPLVAHLNLFNFSIGILSMALVLGGMNRVDPTPLTLWWCASVAAIVLVVDLLMNIVMREILELEYPGSSSGTMREVVSSTSASALGETPLMLVLAIALQVREEFAVFLLLPFAMTYALFVATTRAAQEQLNAEIDPLTGLNNRRRLDTDLERLEAEVVTTEADRQRSWVLLADIDNFKQLNDTQGHDVGDSALVATAAVISKAVRHRDQCYRYGGEEFVVLFTDTCSREEALAIAERIRTIAQQELQTYGVTLSIGLHPLSAGEPAEYALSCADQAMYQVKKSGKNAVRISTDLKLDEPVEA